MSYLRVIPRDLFNEASLLKCLGRLWILLDNLPAGHVARLGNDDGDHDGTAFRIEQSDNDGSINVANLPFRIGGRRYHLSRPLNSRQPWPLYATDDDDEETTVFGDGGEFTPEFRRLIGADQ
jgi:hypothetical protein